MKFNYYPSDISAALAEIAGEDDAAVIENVTGALYDLKAICENPYNSDYLRDLWRVLEKVCSATV